MLMKLTTGVNAFIILQAAFLPTKVVYTYFLYFDFGEGEVGPGEGGNGINTACKMLVKLTTV